ncbi:MAG: VWA domain-containing protein, partial [Vicinamibacterales bacterium]
AVVLLLAAVTTAFSPQQPFRASVDLVHFSVIVTDKQGAPITGLTADDFELVEEGKPQSVTYFLEGFPESGDLGRVLPLHLGLALDTSGSMEDDIHDVRTGMIKFVNANEHAVDTTLVDFDTEVRLARYSGLDYPRLIERIRMRKPDGWTAFYDAVGVYLNGAAEQDGEKILLIYTDGGDTRSAMTYPELITLLKASDVTTYVIGYLEHQPQSAKNEQRMQLQRMAELTGGDAFFPSSVKELEKIYAKIERTIAARYTLGYLSTDTRMNGAWRKIQIRLKRTDLKGAKVRTREGYYAPFKDGSSR